MKDTEEEYVAALENLMDTKEKVAKGDMTLDDLNEAMEEVKFLKEKRKVMEEADSLISQGCGVKATGKAEEDGSEEEVDWEAIDAELTGIIDKIRDHKCKDHAYIIGFQRGDGLVLGINGTGATLKAMFCVLRDQKPFRDIKPMDEKLHKMVQDFVKELED